jgi:peptidoglycan biosynthesis protein MviN/MurJ (putative lipid II flippase)
VSFVLYSSLVVLLVRTSGPIGLGIARSGYFILVAVLSFWLLSRQAEITLQNRATLLMLGRYTLASAAAALVWLGMAWLNNTYTFLDGRIGVLLNLGLSALVGTAVFLAVALVLKADEVKLITDRSLAFAGRYTSRQHPEP